YDRKLRTYQIDPSIPSKKKTLFDRSYEDVYSDPGRVATTYNHFGEPVVLTSSDNALYLIGEGASPEGDRPFLNKMDLTSGKTTTVWRSDAPYYEYVVNLLDY